MSGDGGPGAGRGPDQVLDQLIEQVRAEVCALHAELVRYGLVAWTSGNVSDALVSLEGERRPGGCSAS